MTTRDFAAMCQRMGLDPMKQLGRVEGAEAPKRNKFWARTKEICGIKFASTSEAQTYLVLKGMQDRGEIAELELQPHFVLQEAFTDEQGKRHREIGYTGDFRCLRLYPERLRMQDTVIECKGYETEPWRIRRKLFAKRYPHIRLEVWKNGRPK